eukprot:scaffold7358_cov252-Pinguiococcus_pyrenoidosus.AAC.14
MCSRPLVAEVDGGNSPTLVCGQGRESSLRSSREVCLLGLLRLCSWEVDQPQSSWARHALDAEELDAAL